MCNLLHIHALHEYPNVVNLEFNLITWMDRKKGNEFISIHKEWWAVNDFIFTTLIIYFLWRIILFLYSNAFTFILFPLFLYSLSAQECPTNNTLDNQSVINIGMCSIPNVLEWWWWWCWIKWVKIDKYSMHDRSLSDLHLAVC